MAQQDAERAKFLVEKVIVTEPCMRQGVASVFGFLMNKRSFFLPLTFKLYGVQEIVISYLTNCC